MKKNESNKNNINYISKENFDHLLDRYFVNKMGFAWVIDDNRHGCLLEFEVNNNSYSIFLTKDMIDKLLKNFLEIQIFHKENSNEGKKCYC